MDVDQQFDAVFGQADEALQEEVAAFEADQARKESEGDGQPEVEETPAAPAPVAEAPKEKGADTVPLATFLDTKAELRELKRELESMKTARAAPPEPARVAPPEFKPSVSYEEDPAQYLREENAHMRELISYQGQAVAQTAQMTVEQRQAIEQQQRFQQFTGAINAAEEQYAQEAPDYYDAVEFYRESRAGELRALVEANGIELNAEAEQRIHQKITQEFLEVSQGAFASRNNPAGVLYRLAKARGYAAKAPAATVERIQRGLAASKSSQTVAGAPAPAASESGGSTSILDLQKAAGYRK